MHSFLKNRPTETGGFPPPLTPPHQGEGKILGRRFVSLPLMGREQGWGEPQGKNYVL